MMGAIFMKFGRAPAMMSISRVESVNGNLSLFQRNRVSTVPLDLQRTPCHVLGEALIIVPASTAHVESKASVLAR
jgi:hypothetical protein